MPESNKTEEPTEKRLREAWEEGRFARSPDLQVVAVLAAAAGVIAFGGREYCQKIASLSVGVFGHLGKYAIKPEGVADWAGVSATTMLGLILPVALACAGAGVLAGALQSRFHLSPKVLDFKFERLDPAAGFARIFSKQGWVKLLTDLLKLALVGAVVWSGVKAVMRDPIFFSPVAASRLGGFMHDTAGMLLTRCVLALGGVAAITYIFQLRKTRGELMMTKAEVKEENRQSDGDPKVKMAMRQMARRLLQKQMLASVATADVVVTNPTHFAVALKYERGRDKAPVLLAKGEGAFAKRLKALAAEHEVPMIENKPVARMLFKHGRVGKPIPMELYQAVADILAFVYRTHRYYFHKLKERRADA